LTRVLYFTRDYNTHDHRWLSALSRTGHQIYYLQLERREPVLEVRSLPAGIEPVAWEGGQRPYNAEDLPRLVADLEQVILKVQPDLIQAGPLHLSAYLAACTAFQPLVSMSWGYDLLYEAPRSSEIQQSIRETLRRSSAMVGDCDTIRKLAIQYGMPDDRIVTFPWGIDLAHFSPKKDPGEQAATGRSGADFTLLSTRGWETIYGIDVLARGFAQAARQCPELRLIMLGDGSQGQVLRQIFEQAGVLERVSFPGLAGYLDLPAYYQSADLYVSASHSDGTSISLLEALACGTPALVSDIPGNREWITPQIQGWWFPDGDAQALCDAILRAVEMRQRLPQMGREARRLAEQRADWDKNFPLLFQAYRIALSAKNQTPA
jgi:glycosyltransferase involved in cell wall biosynthesis